MGSLAVLMLHHLVGGTWGLSIRRPLEAGALTLPLMAVLFVPLIFGLEQLYPWARPALVETSEVLKHKAPYFRLGFYLGRTAGYFALWIVLALLLNRWSAQQDQTSDPTPTWWLQAISGPGLALLFLTASFAMIDWAMSIEAKWYSTIYGAMLIVGQGLATFALMIVVAAWLTQIGANERLAGPQQFNDLGNLLLAFTMLWAYLSFSQYLIIWAGNLAEEIPWYLRRTQSGWQWLGRALMAFQFALPFLILCQREVKRQARALAAVAILVLVMHFVDVYWLVTPSFRPLRIGLHWLDLVLPVGIGGLWLATFAWLLLEKELVPQNDPRLAEGTIAHPAETH